MPIHVTATSIIVPTYREAPNLRPLTERLFAALRAAKIEAELIIVDDDSQDGTDEVVKALSEDHPVRLIVRREERGLSGAVLEGFRQARFDRLLVMDADLQHPPEMVPALLDRLGQGDCDFVIGTRYRGGGGIVGDWPFLRRLASRIATGLARPLTPLSDPMSGFFALHRKTWEESAPLDPIGYKIALELYVKGGCQRPAEVPILFRTREAGDSKFNVGEQLRYLRHLAKLYRFRFPRITASLIALVVLGAIAVVSAVFAWAVG
ncbi:MAG: polyprenol monophosphomannose synthase [Planctomycetes bacterium]|nr:polyprenol monophosphomannose synthase [Planctomycetota bacterium]